MLMKVLFQENQKLWKIKLNFNIKAHFNNNNKNNHHNNNNSLINNNNLINNSLISNNNHINNIPNLKIKLLEKIHL